MRTWQDAGSTAGQVIRATPGIPRTKALEMPRLAIGSGLQTAFTSWKGDTGIHANL
jgi:hypothetical protein